MSSTVKTTVFFEVDDLQVSIRSVINAVKLVWAESSHKEKLQDVTIYIKAEHKKAYFVANGGAVTGYVVLDNSDDLSKNVVFD